MDVMFLDTAKVKSKETVDMQTPVRLHKSHKPETVMTGMDIYRMDN